MANHIYRHVDIWLHPGLGASTYLDPDFWHVSARRPAQASRTGDHGLVGEWDGFGCAAGERERLGEVREGAFLAGLHVFCLHHYLRFCGFIATLGI